MKRAWDLFDSVFRWNKKQKKEERRGHFLFAIEPTRLGKLVEDLYYSEFYSDTFLTLDRGPQFSCYETFTLPEFKNHYKGNRELEFEMGISTAWDEEDRFIRSEYVARVFENEIMYYLMKEHGVCYEAAYNYTKDLVPSDRYNYHSFLAKLYQNIRNSLNNDPLCEILCDRVEYLYKLAEAVSRADGYNFQRTFN